MCFWPLAPLLLVQLLSLLPHHTWGKLMEQKETGQMGITYARIPIAWPCHCACGHPVLSVEPTSSGSSHFFTSCFLSEHLAAEANSASKDNDTLQFYRMLSRTEVVKLANLREKFKSKYYLMKPSR